MTLLNVTQNPTSTKLMISKNTKESIFSRAQTYCYQHAKDIIIFRNLFI